VLAEVEPVPALVVATPGAEPVVAGGYACVVLLDTWLTLARTDLRTEEEALRRWLAAAALARPAGDGGRVVAVGDPTLPVLQALLRWDPAGFAGRELEERASAHLPPASRLATLTGDAEDLASALAGLALPAGAEVLGPVPVRPAAGAGRPAGGAPEEPLLERVVVRVPRAAGAALSRTLVELAGVRSARKLPPVRVQVDPVGLE
jgi:primosomal protein N' (replication factor Y)